jgi:cytoskeletal protein RodZ
MVPIGQRLHTIRTQKKLTIEAVAKDIKIRPSFISAIEKGEYHKLPSPAYAQGFVSNYAEYLGLPKRETLALFRREFDEKAAYKVLPEGFTKTKEFPLHRLKIQQSLFIIAGIFILLLAYLGFQYRYLYLPPSVLVTYPAENANISADEINITGRADLDSTVTVNGDPTSLDSKGNFTKQISVFPGKSAITIKARNRSGKETTVTRDITVK